MGWHMAANATTMMQMSPISIQSDSEYVPLVLFPLPFKCYPKSPRARFGKGLEKKHFPYRAHRENVQGHLFASIGCDRTVHCRSTAPCGQLGAHARSNIS